MGKIVRVVVVIQLLVLCFGNTAYGRSPHMLIVNTGTGIVIGLAVLAALVTAFWQYRTNRLLSLQLSAIQYDMANKAVCMEQLTDEKDWLIKEIHHRVKNNLQIVISLLNTQSAYLTNHEAREAIRNSQHRMFAISLIHQKLYQAESLSNIDIPLYISELVDYLKDEYAAGERISFKQSTVPLHLDVALAVPLGLIINEAISNTLKYAFPDAATGQINIALENHGGLNYSLMITDNGIGLPSGFDMNASSSLGISLMAGLSRQLRGTFDLQSQQGVTITLLFKNTEPVKYDLAGV